MQYTVEVFGCHVAKLTWDLVESICLADGFQGLVCAVLVFSYVATCSVLLSWQCHFNINNVEGLCLLYRLMQVYYSTCGTVQIKSATYSICETYNWTRAINTRPKVECGWREKRNGMWTGLWFGKSYLAPVCSCIILWRFNTACEKSVLGKLWSYNRKNSRPWLCHTVMND